MVLHRQYLILIIDSDYSLLLAIVQTHILSSKGQAVVSLEGNRVKG